MNPIFVIVGIPVLIAGIIALLYYFLHVRNTEGAGAVERTTRLLRRFAVMRRYQVLSNVRFTYKGRDYKIENMLIGYFGILLVHTLGGRGSYYGQMDGDQWQRVLEKDKNVFPNPIKQQEEAIMALRGIFAQNKVYNVPVERIVVLTDTSKKTLMYISHGGQILMPGKLKGMLNKSKYENDAGVDVARVAQVITENSK